MRAGPRDRLVTFERRGVTKDSHGGAVETWAVHDKQMAQVVFGTGQERREAAQESATQVATFRVLATPKTTSLLPRDRVAGFMGSDWDITSVALLGRDGVEVTATREIP